MTDVVVELRPHESQQDLLERFRRKVEKSGLLREIRRKRWFVSKSEQHRLAKRRAIRRERSRKKPGWQQGERQLTKITR